MIEQPEVAETDDLDIDPADVIDDGVVLPIEKPKGKPKAAKNEKLKADFYFFCPHLNGTVHGDTCEKNRKLQIPSYSATKCRECRGMPAGTKKIPQAEYHAQVAADIAVNKEKPKSARIPYTAKGAIDAARIYQAKEK